MKPKCEHKWIVFSTAVVSVALILRCKTCGKVGVVKDPTAREWSKAFHAPTDPYPWRGKAARVEVLSAKNQAVWRKHFAESRCPACAGACR